MSCIYIAYAQVKEVRIDKGSYIPTNLILDNVLYTNSGHIDTKNWIGKPLILEFGTTSCPPCMESFQKMNALKSHYSDRLDFYMVTPQQKDFVLKVFKQRGIQHLSDVPVITQDTILKQLFPHRGEPHVVWINRKGKVVAVTNHHYLEKDRIEAFLTEKKLDWPVKWDFPYDDTEKLLVFNPINIRETSRPKRHLYSVVTDHLEGVLPGAGTVIDSVKREKRLYVRNNTLLQMYAKLFSRFYTGDLMPTQIVVDSSHLAKYFYESSLGTLSDWRTKNTYSYEFIFPLDTSQEEMNRTIISQLDLFLGIKVSLKTLNRPCRVLYYIPNSKKKEAKGEIGSSRVKDLLHGLNMIPLEKPLVLSGNFDKDSNDEICYVLPRDAYSDGLDAINKGLAPYGLVIKEQDRFVESLIIEKN